MYIFKKIAALLSVFAISSAAIANYLSIRNVTIPFDNTAANTAQVQFNISWQNSWNDQVNHDAVWLFIKFKDASGNWQHGTLSSAGHQTGTGASTMVIETSADNKGAFFYLGDVTSGPVNQTGVQLQWNYSADGLTSTSGIEFKIFGIEMVYVPLGAFALGDGDGFTASAGSFRSLNAPSYVVVTSSLSPAFKGNFKVDGDGGYDYNADGLIDNPNYPTGYSPFYMMKYEISQEQYADFLNTLTDVQQPNMVPQSVSKMSIVLSNGTYFASFPNRACNGINYLQGLSYADWAGLRPMTEMEYEKACRGPLPAVVGEYAWGTATINRTSSMVGFENGTEKADSPLRNGGYSLGVNRVGFFAEDTTTRINSGASYYGIMDLSGNIAEYYVSDSTFTGLHGDGILSPNGYPNVPDWNTSNCAMRVEIVSDRSQPYGSTQNAAAGIRLGRSSY